MLSYEQRDEAAVISVLKVKRQQTEKASPNKRGTAA